MPQNAAYAISSFRMSSDTAAMKGSGEQRSVHVLDTPMVWLIDSSGVRDVSTGERGGITKGCELSDLELLPVALLLNASDSDNDEESRASTRE